MIKVKILFSAAAVIATSTGILAVKSQKKYNGSYFCTGLKTTNTIKFDIVYTTGPSATITLFCTRVEGVSAPITYRVVANL